MFTFASIVSGSAAVTSVVASTAEPFGCILQTQSGTNLTVSLVGLPITVNSIGVANSPPLISAATATPASVTTTQVTLSVTASDDGGEPALRYDWSAPTVPLGGGVTFSANGTNAAKSSIATFTRSGTYLLRVQATDGGALTDAQDVTVTVTPTATSMVMTPAIAAMTSVDTQTFTVQVRDQFSVALATQPAITWSMDSGSVGSIAPLGLYTAAATGSATVRATAGAMQATASVSVSAVPTPVAHNGGGGSKCGFGTATACFLLLGLALLAGKRTNV